MASVDRRSFNSVIPILNPVVVETTVDLTLSGEQTVNSVAVVSGDRVLVKDQTLPVDNGVYIVSSGAWSRSADFNDNVDVVIGTTVTVINGSWYALSFTGVLSIGVTSLTFTLVNIGNLVNTSVVEKNNVQTVTSVIPRDDTIPQISEGDEVFSINIMAEDAANDLIIDWDISFSNATSGTDFIVAIFQGAGVNAIGAKLVSAPGIAFMAVNSGKIKVNAGSTTLTAYSLRVGVSAGTATVNGASGSPLLGAVPQSSFSIEEVKT